MIWDSFSPTAFVSKSTVNPCLDFFPPSYLFPFTESDLYKIVFFSPCSKCLTVHILLQYKRPAHSTNLVFPDSFKVINVICVLPVLQPPIGIMKTFCSQLAVCFSCCYFWFNHFGIGFRWNTESFPYRLFILLNSADLPYFIL